MGDKIKNLLKIIEDTQKDAEMFDYMSFNQINVGEYCDKQGAAIAALASIMIEVIKEVNG